MPLPECTARCVVHFDAIKVASSSVRQCSGGRVNRKEITERCRQVVCNQPPETITGLRTAGFDRCAVERRLIQLCACVYEGERVYLCACVVNVWIHT